MFVDRGLHLGRSFVHVHVNRRIELVREDPHMLQRAISNRVRSMRSKRRSYQRITEILIVYGQPLGEILFRGLGPFGRRLDHDHADDRPHLSFDRGLCHNVREKIHILKTGRAATDHLEYRELGPVANEFGADPARLGRPDMLTEPLIQRYVVCQATKQRHGGMGVCVLSGRESVRG